MVVVHELNREKKRRVDKFREKCAGLAATRRQFQNHFLIQQDHIVIRGSNQNSSLRTAIQPMHIAAIIIQGGIHYASCKDEYPLEIAIDGILRNFKYVEFQKTAEVSEITIPRLQVRVVLRDKRVKIAIVTVYRLEEKEDETLPEVKYEIW